MPFPVFDTRTMLSMVEQLYPPKTFLLDTFFRNVELSNSKYVDIHIVKGKRRMAAFVHYSSQANQVERIGHQQLTFEPPYMKEKMVITTEELLHQPAGMTIYEGNSSPAERAAMQMAKDLATLQDMMIRREEWMAAQALETGKIAIQGVGYDAEIDFLMDPAHIITLTGGDLWTDASSKPLDNLREWSDKIGEDSGLVPDICILGRDASSALLSNQDARQTLDNRRIEMGQIDPRALPNGAIFLGTLKDPAIDLYRYNEYYWTGATNAPMVPLKKVFMGSTRARTARHYGMIKDHDAGNAAVRWFPKTWIEPDPSLRFLSLQSAAVVAMHQPDGFLVAEVV